MPFVTWDEGLREKFRTEGLVVGRAEGLALGMAEGIAQGVAQWHSLGDDHQRYRDHPGRIRAHEDLILHNQYHCFSCHSLR